MSTVKRVTVLEPISSQVVYDNTTEAPTLRVAAYARVSTEQDEQQSSYEAQELSQIERKIETCEKKDMYIF